MCIFSEVKHKLYTRKREHLFLEKRILLSEALSGLEYILDTIYDAKILITSSPDEIIDNDTIHQLPNLGLPIKNTQKFGNLYITYKIVFPKELDENRKKLILKILPKRKGLTPASQYLTCKTPQICQDRDIVLSRDGLKNPIKQMLENMLGGDIFGGDMFGLGLGIDLDIGDSMGECVQQ